ncbi:MAG: hypothetical protein GY938_07745 [Ketobacter sp.]|nr:hypothetical protein [Ketobacter sp.]
MKSLACEEHITIENCSTYSNFAANTCSTCVFDHFPIPVLKKCVDKTATIPNCVKYKSNTECYACASNHWLNEANTACQLGNIANCVEYDTSLNCTMCSSNKVFNGPACVDPYQSMTQQCYTSNY